MARPRHLPEIEVLRGVAVMLVILQHMPDNLLVATPPLFDRLLRHVDFSTGVDLFFAISGFVIARSLLPGLRDAHGFRGFVTIAGAFWIRRAWRLMPSAWFWLAVILVASACFNDTGLFGSMRTNAWAAVAGILDFANIRFAYAFGTYKYGASFAWWSLSLEEQFYLLLPPLAFICRRWLPLLLIPAIIYEFQMPRTVLLMVFRTDAILMGVLLACWEPHPSFARAGQWLCRLPRPATFMAACALLLLLVTRRHGPQPFDIGLMGVFGTALVFLAAQDEGLILPASPVRRVMTWIGGRSYALYLIHIPAFFAAREFWFRTDRHAGDITVVATAGAILLVCAELNWRLIEQTLRRHGAMIADGFMTRRLLARPA